MVQSIFPIEAVKFMHRWFPIDIVYKIANGTATDEQYDDFTDLLEEYGERNGWAEGWWMTYTDDETLWAKEVREYVYNLFSNEPYSNRVEFSYNKYTQTLAYSYTMTDGTVVENAVTGEFAWDKENACYYHDIYAEDINRTIRIYFES